MCETAVLYLPTVVDGKVRELKNGSSKWTLQKNMYTEKEWEVTKEGMYGWVGRNYERWAPIADGDQMVYSTKSSTSPAINQMTWRDGNWYAWLLTTRCGRGHWSKLIVVPLEKYSTKTGAFCDTGWGCKG